MINLFFAFTIEIVSSKIDMHVNTLLPNGAVA